MHIKEVYEQVGELNEMFLHSRYEIMRFLHPEMVPRPADREALNGLLYQNAVNESELDRPKLYTNVLKSIRGPSISSVLTRIEKVRCDMSQYSSFLSSNNQELLSESRRERRDVLRRLMTQLAQETGYLPKSLKCEHVKRDAHIDGGGFSTVHSGRMMYEGKDKMIALKALQATPRTTDSRNILRVRTVSYMKQAPTQSLNRECTWRCSPASLCATTTSREFTAYLKIKMTLTL